MGMVHRRTGLRYLGHDSFRSIGTRRSHDHDIGMATLISPRPTPAPAPAPAAQPTRRLGRRLGLLFAAFVLLVSMVGVPSAGAAAYATTTPMILHNVPPEDLVANRHGICDGDFKIAVKNVGGTAGALRYLDAAKGCGLKAVLFFADTANHSTGAVYPSRVAALVKSVKDHPALYGYLSVKEPSWVGITGTEIRSLYKAYRAADPNHPVVALFGDIPHFGSSRNPYLTGMADIVMVGWYPVETASGGCSRTGSTYIANGPKWFKLVNAKVQAVTPGRPIWLMAQTHKYLAPSCHKKQRPTESQLRRQVRDALVYLGADGVAFHTFRNTNYESDLYRDAAMVRSMKTISRQIAAGTF